MNKAAALSTDKLYRYLLTREWDGAKGRLGWIMLNPSTADSVTDDATIRLCIGWAKRLLYGGISVANLFALRSTDPKALYSAQDPVGPANMTFIQYVLDTCPMVICAWGRHGNTIPTGHILPALLSATNRAYPGKLHALRLNKDGSPAHPLRIPYSTVPVLYNL